MSTINARQTEYKGVLYRSKCEAMFARVLELECYEIADSEGTQIAGFEYEPDYLRVGDWVPDFLRFYTTTVWRGAWWGPCMHYDVIEYKPSRPTSAYIAEFYQRFKSLRSSLFDSGCGFALDMSANIYWGSVYSDKRGIIRAIPEGNAGNKFELSEPSDLNQDWLGWCEQKVRDTRFDLEQSEDR